MTPGLVLDNIIAYSLQIGLLVGVVALAPVLLRMRSPHARLLFWQVLLVACLALPFVRSWRQEVLTGTAIQISAIVQVAAATAAAPIQHRPIPFTTIALWILAAGIAIRLTLLVVGLARLAAYRRRGEELPREFGIPGTSARAALLISEDVAGPVTFGWNEPVILLPANFPDLEPAMREAIICHELLHVERRDWLFTIAEGMIRSVLWFHPAVWWVIGEVQLAREQTVDQAVIELTRTREPYVDALLLMAGVSEVVPQFDLAPAPMFLRRRHLKRRLVEVMKEVRMTTISAKRLACVMSAAVVMVAAACWLAAGAFPLSAAPQVVDDAAGVTVNTNGSPLLHRSSVPYPADALAKGVEGTVVVQLKLDPNGEVSDAAVLSGPDELRRGVLQSVLTWHFDKSAASTTRAVNINFVRPANAAPVQPVAPAPALRTLVPVPALAGGGQGGSGGLGAARGISGRIDRITIAGLSAQSSADLLSKLPVHEGDELTSQSQSDVMTVAKDFDSHLTTTLARNPTGGFELRISPMNTGSLALPTFTANSGPGGGFGSAGSVATAQAFAPTSTTPAGIFSVGNGTTPPSVLSKVDPEYSEQARAAKYSGSVMLSIVVNTDGKAEDIKVVKTLGMGLDEKAIESVQKWNFRPGMNKGVPVNVRAQIEVNFRLLDKQE